MLIDNVVVVIVAVAMMIGNSSSRSGIICCFLVFNSGQFRRFAGTHFVSSSLDGLDDVLWRRCVRTRLFCCSYRLCTNYYQERLISELADKFFCLKYVELYDVVTAFMHKRSILPNQEGLRL